MSNSADVTAQRIVRIAVVPLIKRTPANDNTHIWRIMTRQKWPNVALAVLLVVGMGAAAYGSWHWEQGTTAILARLEAARVSSSPSSATSTLSTRCNARELEGLPAPVQRDFRAVLKDGQPIIAAASIEQAGTFNMSETAQQWKPFTARQRVITQRPGFDWDARIMMFPAVLVHIHDAYIAGQGILRGAVSGLVPVVNMTDTPYFRTSLRLHTTDTSTP